MTQRQHLRFLLGSFILFYSHSRLNCFTHLILKLQSFEPSGMLLAILISPKQKRDNLATEFANWQLPEPSSWTVIHKTFSQALDDLGQNMRIFISNLCFVTTKTYLHFKLQFLSKIQQPRKLDYFDITMHINRYTQPESVVIYIYTYTPIHLSIPLHEEEVEVLGRPRHFLFFLVDDCKGLWKYYLH